MPHVHIDRLKIAILSYQPVAHDTYPRSLQLPRYSARSDLQNIGISGAGDHCVSHAVLAPTSHPHVLPHSARTSALPLAMYFLLLSRAQHLPQNLLLSANLSSTFALPPHDQNAYLLPPSHPLYRVVAANQQKTNPAQKYA